MESVSIQPWLGPDVSSADVSAVVESARQVWERLGLTLQVQPVRSLPSTAPDRLFTSGGAESPSAPLRQLLALLPESPDAISLVVVPRIVDTAAVATSLRGFTLPAGGASMGADELPDALSDLPPRLSPVVFIDGSALARAPGDLSLTPAHEVGHALGLAHRSSRSALMSSGPLSLRCIPSVSAEEWDTVQANLWGETGGPRGG